jgi:quinolinate synthase
VKDVKRLREQNPGCVVVGYVNTSADVKAELDICCTSANAEKVIRSIPKDKPIVFVPDKYLAAYTSYKTGRSMVIWNGYCPSHAKILPQDIIKAKYEHPNAKVMTHPECRMEVNMLADAVVSTAGMLKYAKETDATEFIVGTEIDMAYRLSKDNPGKKFYPASNLAVCPNMKKITLEKVLWSMEEMKPQVKIPEDIRIRGLNAVNRMIEIV